MKFDLPTITPRDPVMAENLKPLTKALEGALDRHLGSALESAQKLQADPELSEEGKRRRIGEQLKIAVDQVEKAAHREIQPFRAKTANLKQKLADRLEPGPSKDAHELRLNRRQAQLLALDPEDRYKAALEMARAGDRATLDLVEEMPPGILTETEAGREAIRSAYLEATESETLEDLDGREEILSAAEGVVFNLRKALPRLAGDFEQELQQAIQEREIRQRREELGLDPDTGNLEQFQSPAESGEGSAESTTTSGDEAA